MRKHFSKKNRGEASTQMTQGSQLAAETTQSCIKEEDNMKKNRKAQASTKQSNVQIATADSVSAPVEGATQNEKFMWLDNAALQISPDIQRKLDPMRVADIVANFSPLVANPIKVSFRDGKYYIFDGMHTRTAIRELNGTDDFPIFCRVYYGLTEEDEARLFAAQFGYSEPVPMAYRLRARAKGKDPEVLDFLKITRGCGFSITLGRNVPGNGRIVATCAAFKMFLDLGGEMYKRMLKILHRTWAGESWSVSRNMLGGMSRFLKMYDFHDTAFVKAMRGVTHREVVMEADRFPGMARDGAFATALGEIFDRNSSSLLQRIR
jgi:hypothetical protein